MRLFQRLLAPCVVCLALVASASADDLATRFPVEDAKTRLSAVGPAEKYNADTVVVVEHIDVRVRPSGIGEETTHRITKVLREGAIRGLSVLRFDFDPTTNRLSVPLVRVHRDDGAVEQIDTAAAAEQPAPQWGIYWGSRQRLIGLPRLVVGDAVESVSVKTGYNVAYLADEGAAGDETGADLVPPMPGHWYDEVSFWSGVPVIEKRYTVRCPKDKPLQFAVYNGEVRTAVTFEGESAVYSFEKHDIPVFHGEGGMVNAGDVNCKVVLATLADWESKARWFNKANEPAFEINDEIRAKVKEITAGLAGDEEKITALNHWVAENIRYVGTSRGACEGYTTHKAIETFSDRGGVCKDKAGLLVAMLRAAGFESYIVMTMAGAEVFPVPADQFNHAVTSIREKDGSLRLFDPTWMPKSRDNWSNFESLQHVVYGTPEGQPLARSPYCPPERNTVQVAVESELRPGGELQSRFRIEAIGGPETNLRRALAGRTPTDRDRTLEDSLSRLSADARLLSWSATDPVDFRGPMHIETEIAAGGYSLGDRDRRLFQLPALRGFLFEHLVGDVTGLGGPATRSFATKARTTRKAVIDETIHIPKDWSIDAAPDAVNIDGPVISLKFEPTKSVDSLRYHCELELKKHRIEPADYPAVKQALDAFDRVCGAWVTLRTEANRAQR
ncbi:MAG: DUF3857 domain-containing protein [Planctomycetes bacterium]|nr:DUF3857 domain-containing protein [Planctomycetota bacterium]